MYQPLFPRVEDASSYAADHDAPGDGLWEEHGWALGSSGLAVLVLVILVASALIRILG